MNPIEPQADAVPDTSPNQTPPPKRRSMLATITKWALLLFCLLVLTECFIWPSGIGGQVSYSENKQFTARLGTQGWEALGGYYSLSVYLTSEDGKLGQQAYHLKIPCSQKYFAPLREVRGSYLSWQGNILTVSIPFEHTITIDCGQRNPPPVFR